MEQRPQRAIGWQLCIHSAEGVAIDQPEGHPGGTDVLALRQFGHIVVEKLGSSTHRVGERGCICGATGYQEFQTACKPCLSRSQMVSETEHTSLCLTLRDSEF